MRMLLIALILLTGCLVSSPLLAADSDASAVEPLVVGESFTLHSATLDEDRRINVYIPYDPGPDQRPPLPIMVMPDGGLAEDFIHVMGLLQVGVGNGTMRPFLLVGIENTQRRRDLTGPTEDPRDREIAPVVGGSAAFRDFIRDELLPEIARRYSVTEERAIVGESLAGLFVLETFVLEPALFDHYLAIDPSLWWNRGQMVEGLAETLSEQRLGATSLFVATGQQPEIRELSQRFVRILGEASLQLRVVHAEFDESHATIYHPAALQGFRALFAPTPEPESHDN